MQCLHGVPGTGEQRGWVLPGTLMGVVWGVVCGEVRGNVRVSGGLGWVWRVWLGAWWRGGEWLGTVGV